jgi:hypothetical protein
VRLTIAHLFPVLLPQFMDNSAEAFSFSSLLGSMLSAHTQTAISSAQAFRAAIGTTLPAPAVSTLPQYSAHAAISFLRLSNKSPRR